MSTSLDEYRKKASFDPNELVELLDSKEIIEYRRQKIAELEREPLFKRGHAKLSLKENREVNHRRWKRIVEMGWFPDASDIEQTMANLQILETYDQGLSARYGLHTNTFIPAIQSMGTEKHQKILKQAYNNEIVGCFCLTELSHGSNTAAIQTTVTYKDGSLVFHSPTPSSFKVWAGNLSQSATHAVVYAKLIVDGKNHGNHGFVVQVRDFKTHEPLPGIRIGDMGEKPGDWNGVENGWMAFTHHVAPLDTLLNKGCEITPDGKYVSAYKSVSEKQSVTLGALSIGRLGIIGKGILACAKGATIAIRYSMARRQFGEPNQDECPVWEYPLQQHRLLPYLSAAITTRIFHKKFIDFFTEYLMRVMQGEKSDELAEFSKEIHALSSAAKVQATFMGVEALGEARRCCGGHGFLHASGLNSSRASFDPSQTFEGENNMLLQQTSNILVAKINNGSVDAPMSTFKFLRANPAKFSGVWKNNILDDIVAAYDWLIVYLTKSTSDELDAKKNQGKTPFAARNETQVHLAHSLSLAYAERTIIAWAYEFVKTVEKKNLEKVLNNVVALYGLFLLEKHLATLYIGGYCTGSEFGSGVRSQIRSREAALAPEAAALVDAIDINDFLLNSALGHSDGRPYDHILEEFYKYENMKPDWWSDLSGFLHQQRSKL